MSKAPASKTRQRKVECLDCGVIVRMSRAAMLKSGLPTCGCGTPMTCSDLEDLAVVAPEDPRVVAAEAEVEEYVTRSLHMQRRFGGKAGSRSRGLGPDERLALARERAHAAVVQRDAEYLRRSARPVAAAASDEIPF